MWKRQAVFLAMIVGWCAWAVADDRAPIRLSNSHMALRFDRRTGAWIGLVDAQSGEELVTGHVLRTMILPPPIQRLDLQAIHRAAAAHQAVELSGDWLYTPAPSTPTVAASIVQGRFDAGRWAANPGPKPSRQRRRPSAQPCRRRSSTGENSPALRMGRMRKWSSSSVPSTISM